LAGGWGFGGQSPKFFISKRSAGFAVTMELRLNGGSFFITIFRLVGETSETAKIQSVIGGDFPVGFGKIRPWQTG